jgi:hypothetical protein
VDPNKYKKNANIKADSLTNTLQSVGSLLLMLLGLVGIAMELFKEGGWLKSTFSWLFESGSHMIFIPVIIFVFWFLNRIISSTPDKNEIKKSGNLPMYMMMGLGAFYLFRLIMTGDF